MRLNGWRSHSPEEQVRVIEKCIRCIRLDPEVSLVALGQRFGVHRNLLADRLAARGFRRGRYGLWRTPDAAKGKR